MVSEFLLQELNIISKFQEPTLVNQTTLLQRLQQIVIVATRTRCKDMYVSLKFLTCYIWIVVYVF